MRDHEPLVIDDFNGLWARGDNDTCPQDHFTDCLNLQYSQSSVLTRAKITLYKEFLHNIKRSYVYTKSNTNQQIIVLDDTGRFWAIPIVDAGSITLILTIPTATDFGFVNFNGRAYISPSDGNLGLVNEFVYVYKGDYLSARKAGGIRPTTLLSAAAGGAGNVEIGTYLLGCSFETDTGFLTHFDGSIITFGAAAASTINLSSIPLGPAGTSARRIVASKAIFNYTNNIKGYQYFFVPNGRIGDNTTTTLTLNFFNSELIDDASYLFDIFDNPTAGAGLGTYHNRLISWAENANPSVIRVSNVNDPETIDQTDGLVTVDLANSLSPLTNAIEYRDTLYPYKINKTYQTIDNGDVPSSWNSSTFDDGIGTFPLGIATVLSSGGRTVDSLFILDRSGLYYFDGTYHRPEVTWKIDNIFKDGFLGQGSTFATKYQVVNDSLSKRLYILLPRFASDGFTEQRILYFGDYSNTETGSADFHLKIKWCPWISNTTVLGQLSILDIGYGKIFKIVNNVGNNFYLFEDVADVTGKFLGALTSQFENRPTPFFQTALFGDGDRNIVHLGMIRARVTGQEFDNDVFLPPPSQKGSAIQIEAINLDSTKSSLIKKISVGATPGQDQLILADYIAQRFMLKFSAIDSYNQYFNFNLIAPYIKPIFSQFAFSSEASLIDSLGTILTAGEIMAVESGNWIPAFGGSTSQSGQVYTNQIGRYIKLPITTGGFGGLILAQGRVTLSTLGTITGNVQFQGLPFTTKNLTGMRIPCVIGIWSAMTTNWIWLGGYADPNTSVITLQGRASAGTGTVNLAQADLSNTTDMTFHLVYESEN